MLYAAAHLVSKRNMMYILRPNLPVLTAAWAPGVPQPKKSQADEFLHVRLGGIPAGARKLYVTKKQGIVAHVGVSYYLKGTDIQPFTADQNRNEFHIACSCAMSVERLFY